LKLSELNEAWEKDSRIDELNLGRESINVPLLHSKYLTFLSKTKLQLRKAESDYLNTKRLKNRYYKGEMSRQELEELGWDQYQGNKPLRTELGEMIEIDRDIIELQDKMEYFKTIIYTLEQVIRSINSRSFDIKNYIEWHKMNNGMM
jgi:hypothetical protein